MAKYSIIGPGYQGRSLNVNASRCINLYPELNSQDSKSVGSLIGTPGLLLYIDTLLGPIRGMHFFNNLIYFVSANKLYYFDVAGNLFPANDNLGNHVILATIDGRVLMADNGMYSVGGAVANQLAFVDGQNIYVYNVSTGVLFSSAVPSKTIAFINGYFMIDAGGAQIKLSSLYDGTSWPALAFTTADAYPDNLNAVINNHNEGWMLGEYSCEILVPDGSTNPFPFSRMTTLDYGTKAPYSVAKGNNTLFWLVSQRNGTSGEVIGIGMADGYGVRIVTPQSINYQISKYKEVTDAWAYCYTDKGHEFYVLTFPTENATWVYDATTGLCHERSYYSGDPYKINRHLGNAYAYAWGKHFVGSYIDGKIYEMSEDYYTDNGQPIASVRISPPMDDEYNTFIKKLQLDAETGIGIEGFSWGAINTISTGAYPYLGVNDGNGYIWILNWTDGTVSKIDPTSNIVVATVTIGVHPAYIVYASDYIWISNYTSGTVSKINPVTNTVDATIIVGNHPNGMSFDGNSHIWVANEADDTVSKINTSTNNVDATVAVGTMPQGVILSAGYIYVSNRNSNNISKINIATDAVDATIAVGNTPYSRMATNNTYLWVINWSDKTVSKINCATDAVDATIAVGTSPMMVKVYNDKVWAANFSDNTITIFDAITDAVDATITVGNGPYDLLDFDNYIFVVNQTSGNISVVDVSLGIVVDTISVGSLPSFIMTSTDLQHLIVSNSDDNTITNINIYNNSDIDDPSAILSWSVDGGHTWSNDHPVKMGKIGQYMTRMIWRRLGCSRNRCFRVAIISAAKKVLFGCYMDFEKGIY